LEEGTRINTPLMDISDDGDAKDKESGEMGCKNEREN